MTLEIVPNNLPPKKNKKKIFGGLSFLSILVVTYFMFLDESNQIRMFDKEKTIVEKENDLIKETFKSLSIKKEEIVKEEKIEIVKEEPKVEMEMLKETKKSNKETNEQLKEKDIPISEEKLKVSNKTQKIEEKIVKEIKEINELKFKTPNKNLKNIEEQIKPISEKPEKGEKIVCALLKYDFFNCIYYMKKSKVKEDSTFKVVWIKHSKPNEIFQEKDQEIKAGITLVGDSIKATNQEGKWRVNYYQNNILQAQRDVEIIINKKRIEK